MPSVLCFGTNIQLQSHLDSSSWQALWRQGVTRNTSPARNSSWQILHSYHCGTRGTLGVAADSDSDFNMFCTPSSKHSFRRVTLESSCDVGLHGLLLVHPETQTANSKGHSHKRIVVINSGRLPNRWRSDRWSLSLPCIEQNTMVTILQRTAEWKTTVMSKAQWKTASEFMGRFSATKQALPISVVWCHVLPPSWENDEFQDWGMLWCKTVVQGEVYASKLGPKAFANVFQIGYYLTSFPLNAFTRHIAVHMPPGL